MAAFLSFFELKPSMDASSADLGACERGGVRMAALRREKGVCKEGIAGGSGVRHASIESTFVVSNRGG